MTSIAEIFKSACANNKPYMSFEDLPYGDHVIDNFHRVNTELGDRIRIETNNSSLFLPQRFSRISDEVIADLNEMAIIMSYEGRHSDDHERLLLVFGSDTAQAA